jgi:cell wall-associated NlpC family hydrolase
VRFRALGSTVCSIAILLATAASAAASGNGSSGSSSSVGGVAPEAPSATHAANVRKPTHNAPVTSSSAGIAYSGPVYERTSSGQIVPYQTATTATELKEVTGGVVGALPDGKPELLVPGHLARVVGGLAAAPMLAPSAVQKIIWAGNQIVGLPYIYGGGHASFKSRGYDCSGTVSFALHGAHLLPSPEDSSELEQWGSHGLGKWVTVFTNPGHAYMTVAGLRLDTSAAYDPSNQQGPRWRPLRSANEGFSVRHPTGL